MSREEHRGRRHSSHGPQKSRRSGARRAEERKKRKKKEAEKKRKNKSRGKKSDASYKREKVLSEQLRKDQLARLSKVSEDHLTQLTFRNRLPDVAVDPKTLADASKRQNLVSLFLPDKQLMMNTLESGRYDQKVTVEADLGLPLDLVDIDSLGTRKRWKQQCKKKKIHPDDQLLLEDSDEEKQRTIRHYGMAKLMAKHGWIQALDIIDNNLTKEGMGKVSASKMHDDNVKELEQFDRFAKLGLLDYAPVLIKLGVKDTKDLYKSELKDKLHANMQEVEAARLCDKIDAIKRRDNTRHDIDTAAAVSLNIEKTFEDANAEVVNKGERLYDRPDANKENSLGWVEVTRVEEAHVFVRPVTSATGGFRRKADISAIAMEASQMNPDNEHPEWKWTLEHAKRVKEMPIHPTMPHRKAKRVWDLLPADELWLHKYAYLMMSNQDPVSFAKQRTTEKREDAENRLQHAIVRNITQEQWGLVCSLDVPRPEAEQEKARAKCGPGTICEEAGRFLVSIDSETDQALNPILVMFGDTGEEDVNGIERGTAEYFFMRNSISLRSVRQQIKKSHVKDSKMVRRENNIIEQQKHELRIKRLKPDFNLAVDSDDFDDSDGSDSSSVLGRDADNASDDGDGPKQFKWRGDKIWDDNVYKCSKCQYEWDACVCTGPDPSKGSNEDEGESLGSESGSDKEHADNKQSETGANDDHNVEEDNDDGDEAGEADEADDEDLFGDDDSENEDAGGGNSSDN